MFLGYLSTQASAAHAPVLEANLATQKAAGAERVIYTELKAAEKFWSAETYHQQYLQKGGQSAKKEASETIRCYA